MGPWQSGCRVCSGLCRPPPELGGAVAVKFLVWNGEVRIRTTVDEAKYVPAGQFVQALTVPGEKAPEGQRLQYAEPAVAYWPGLHWAQELAEVAEMAEE